MATTHTDAELRAGVERALRDDLRLTIDRLLVVVTRGAVSIRGQVPNLLQKREAGAVARLAAGREVADELALGPAGSSSDHDLRYAVEDAIVRDRRLSEHLVDKKVSVEVHGGAVVLTGLVDVAAERHFVEEDTWPLPGVAAIDNRIAVGPAPPRADGEIATDIFETLRANPWLDSTGIAVAVQAGIARLTGRVPDRDQKRRAGDAAWWVPGVRGVRNELVIGR